MRLSLRGGRATGSTRRAVGVCLLLGLAALSLGQDTRTPRHGGRVTVALRSEPKTLNPVTAVDVASRDVIERLHASLISIDRDTQQTVPALAESWAVDDDGRRYTLRLREGLRFSDGKPLDARDVVFSIGVFLDERNASPQREFLVVGGRPIEATAIDSRTVVVELAEPYAAAERLFAGLPILPEHLLADEQDEGTLASAWTLGTPPNEIVGAGPFVLDSYVPGERVRLARNPHYWRRDTSGTPLPYLDEIVFLIVANRDAQVLRFRAGDTDAIEGLDAQSFAALQRDGGSRDYELYDLGPGLEYSFLFFNLNHVPPDASASATTRRSWFGDVSFRRAVSRAIDRSAIVRLVYRGRGAPLGTHVTPGNKLWRNEALAPPERSLDAARQLLRSAGFAWRPDGSLIDPRGTRVEFSMLTGAGNAARQQIASVIQDDLGQLGMRVNVVPLETGALLQRVLESLDYEACLLALRSGDVDPISEMNVWLSTGATHLWSRSDSLPPIWQQEIDALMRRQVGIIDVAERRRLYDRVQAIVAEQLPMIPLVSPSVLVGARRGLEGLRPAILGHYTLWNADQLYWNRDARRD